MERRDEKEEEKLKVNEEKCEENYSETCREASEAIASYLHRCFFPQTLNPSKNLLKYIAKKEKDLIEYHKIITTIFDNDDEKVIQKHREIQNRYLKEFFQSEVVVLGITDMKMSDNLSCGPVHMLFRSKDVDKFEFRITYEFQNVVNSITRANLYFSSVGVKKKECKRAGERIKKEKKNFKLRNYDNPNYESLLDTRIKVGLDDSHAYKFHFLKELGVPEEEITFRRFFDECERIQSEETERVRNLEKDSDEMKISRVKDFEKRVTGFILRVENLMEEDFPFREVFGQSRMKLLIIVGHGTIIQKAFDKIKPYFHFETRSPRIIVSYGCETGNYFQKISEEYNISTIASFIKNNVLQSNFDASEIIRTYFAMKDDNNIFVRRNRLIPQIFVDIMRNEFNDKGLYKSEKMAMVMVLRELFSNELDSQIISIGKLNYSNEFKLFVGNHTLDQFEIPRGNNDFCYVLYREFYRYFTSSKYKELMKERKQNLCVKDHTICFGSECRERKVIGTFRELSAYKCSKCKYGFCSIDCYESEMHVAVIGTNNVCNNERINLLKKCDYKECNEYVRSNQIILCKICEENGYCTPSCREKDSVYHDKICRKCISCKNRFKKLIQKCLVCKEMMYCSLECLKNHEEFHKLDCKMKCENEKCRKILDNTNIKCEYCRASFYCEKDCRIIHWEQGHGKECSWKFDGEENVLRKKSSRKQKGGGRKKKNKNKKTPQRNSRRKRKY